MGACTSSAPSQSAVRYQKSNVPSLSHGRDGVELHAVDEELPMQVTSKKTLSGVGSTTSTGVAPAPKAARGYADLGAVEPEASPDSDDDDVRASAVLAATSHAVDPMHARLNEYATSLKAAGKTRLSNTRPTFVLSPAPPPSALTHTLLTVCRTVVMSRASDGMILVDHTNEDGRESLPSGFAAPIVADSAPAVAAAAADKMLNNDDDVLVDAAVTQRSTGSKRQVSSPVQTRSLDLSTYELPVAGAGLSSGVITTLSPSTGGAVSPPDMAQSSVTPAGSGAGPASPTGPEDVDELIDF